MAAFPVADPEASPLPEMLTTRASKERQLTLPLTSLEEPSAYVAVAVSCVVPPSTTVGWLGEIESAVKDCPSLRDGRSKPASTRSSPRHSRFGLRDNALRGERSFTITTSHEVQIMRTLCATGFRQTLSRALRVPAQERPFRKAAACLRSREVNAAMTVICLRCLYRLFVAEHNPWAGKVQQLD